MASGHNSAGNAPVLFLHKIIASAGGIGMIGKGGGTLAALAVCLLYFFAPAGYSQAWQVFFLLAVLLIGTWSSHRLENLWGHDSSRVVIDEVAGMMITLMAVPLNAVNILVGLLLFRFFDIAKPLGVRKAEKLPGGLGVMADDVLAGTYGWLVLQALLLSKAL